MKPRGSCSLKIFGIETSSPLFSLCIAHDGDVVHMVKKSRVYDDTSRDGKFFEEAEQLLRSHGSDPVEAIAVAVGPGKFTSLRVGLSLAKGLAFARGIPIVGVNTLDVIGAQFSFLDIPVCAVINAYHEELYAAVYRKGERIGEYALTTPQELGNMLQQHTLIIGSGVAVIKKHGVPYECECVDNESFYPDAAKVVRMGLNRVYNRQFEDADGLEPFYLKPTDAERNYRKKNAH